MGQVFVRQAELSANQVVRLRVEMNGLPSRTIDRSTAIAWMRDGHSLLAGTASEATTALQLVEVGEDAVLYIRQDNAPIAADALPALPPLPSA